MEKTLIIGLILAGIFGAGIIGTAYAFDHNIDIMGGHNSHMIHDNDCGDNHDEYEQSMAEDCEQLTHEECEENHDDCEEYMDKNCEHKNNMCDW